MGLPRAHYAARGVGVQHFLLAVLFGRKTKQRQRLPDLYRLSTGEYLSSHLRPNEAADLAWTGEIFLLFDRISLYPGLVAVRPRASTPE